MEDTQQEPNKRYRLEVQTTAEQDALIRQAPDREHEGVNAFALKAAIERSRTMLETRNTITLGNDAYDRFYTTPDFPPKAVPELTVLFHAPPFPRG